LVENSKLTTSNSIGAQDQNTRHIFLQTDRIRATAEMLGVDPKIFFTYSLCHEIVHDYSFSQSEGSEDFYKSQYPGNIIKELLAFWRKPKDKVLDSQTGYSLLKIISRGITNPLNPGDKMVDVYRQYTSFDEAVTDKVAFELLQEYAKSSGQKLSKTEIDKLIFLLSDVNNPISHWTGDIERVDDLVRELSESTGLDKQVVWQAVKRGKFGKENTSDPETRAILEQELPKSLWKKLLDSDAKNK